LNIGDIDETELSNIQPMIDAFGNSIEVLEASDGVFRFKYWGLIKNQIGMEAWGRQMIMDNHPYPESVQSVTFVTTRKRDTLLGEKI